jgi:hypothetical protein
MYCNLKHGSDVFRLNRDDCICQHKMADVSYWCDIVTADRAYEGSMRVYQGAVSNFLLTCDVEWKFLASIVPADITSIYGTTSSDARLRCLRFRGANQHPVTQNTHNLQFVAVFRRSKGQNALTERPTSKLNTNRRPLLTNTNPAYKHIELYFSKKWLSFVVLWVIFKSTSLPCFMGRIFEVILAVNTNITVVWSVTPWGFVSKCHHCWRICSLFFRIEYLKMEAKISSETLVLIY